MSTSWGVGSEGDNGFRSHGQVGTRLYSPHKFARVEEEEGRVAYGGGGQESRYRVQRARKLAIMVRGDLLKKAFAQADKAVASKGPRRLVNRPMPESAGGGGGSEFSRQWQSRTQEALRAAAMRRQSVGSGMIPVFGNSAATTPSHVVLQQDRWDQFGGRRSVRGLRGLDDALEGEEGEDEEDRSSWTRFGYSPAPVQRTECLHNNSLAQGRDLFPSATVGASSRRSSMMSSGSDQFHDSNDLSGDGTFTLRCCENREVVVFVLANLITDMRVMQALQDRRGQDLSFFESEISGRHTFTEDDQRALQAATSSIFLHERTRDASQGGLDGSQNALVNKALNKERGLTICQGPPGTGKTRAIVWLLAGLALRERVHATGPTNRSVEELATKYVRNIYLAKRRCRWKALEDVFGGEQGIIPVADYSDELVVARRGKMTEADLRPILVCDRAVALNNFLKVFSRTLAKMDAWIGDGDGYAGGTNSGGLDELLRCSQEYVVLNGKKLGLFGGPAGVDKNSKLDCAKAVVRMRHLSKALRADMIEKLGKQLWQARFDIESQIPLDPIRWELAIML